MFFHLLMVMQENDAIERETTHRQQLLDVQTAVKRRFDYQLQLQLLKRQFEQRQLVGWIKEQVLQSVRSKPVRLNIFTSCASNCDICRTRLYHSAWLHSRGYRLPTKEPLV